MRTRAQIPQSRRRYKIPRYWPWIKYHDIGRGWTFVSAFAGKNSVNAVTGGVSMLIGPRALKLLNSIEKIQPRIMVATFNSNLSTTIIFCYSPTNASDKTDLDAFYNELSSFVRSIPKHNVLIIGEDMNAGIYIYIYILANSYLLNLT